MSKLRVAVLDDDATILKELVGQLRTSGIVEVVAHAIERSDFISKVESSVPEALILDIDLTSEPDGGLRVAHELALPVFFISGHVARNIEAIEILDVQRIRLPVAHLTKAYSEEALRAKLRKFCDEIRARRTQRRVTLREKGRGSTIDVNVDSIVAIVVDPNGATSNDKRVLFNDRKPITIADITLSRLGDFGFPAEEFTRISNQCAVNRSLVVEWTGSFVKLQYMTDGRSMTTETWDIKKTFRGKRG